MLEAHLVDCLAGAHKGLVARHVVRRDLGHLAPHRLGVTAVVEYRAVVKAHAVERCHRAQVHIVTQLAATQLPQLLEQKRRGDDRGPGVEGEAILPVDIGPPARGVELLQHGDAVASGTQPHGSGQATEAAADHHGMGPCI